MKATLYFATSLNGLITTGKNNSDWVSDIDAENFDRICEDHGCILVGGNTFRQYEGEIYPIKNTENIVLTTTKPIKEYDQTYFKNTFDSAIKEIGRLGFSRFLIAGGANISKQCFESKLVDKVYISIHPFIFSSGLNMSENFGYDVSLKFVGIKQQHEDFVLIEYDVFYD